MASAQSPQVSESPRSGLLRFAALEIRDHFIDCGNFVLESLLRLFEYLDPLFARVKMPATPGAATREAGEESKTFREWVEIRLIHNVPEHHCNKRPRVSPDQATETWQSFIAPQPPGFGSYHVQNKIGGLGYFGILRKTADQPARVTLSSRRQQLCKAELVPVRISDMKEALAP